MADELSPTDRKLLAHALAWQTLKDVAVRLPNGAALTELMRTMEEKSFLAVNAADLALPKEPHPPR